MVAEAGSEGQPGKEDESENECLCITYKASSSTHVLMCMNVSVSPFVAF